MDIKEYFKTTAGKEARKRANKNYYKKNKTWYSEYHKQRYIKSLLKGGEK